jgi:WD40 repeat protein/biotin carboxyl carrier protein
MWRFLSFLFCVALATVGVLWAFDLLPTGELQANTQPPPPSTKIKLEQAMSFARTTAPPPARASAFEYADRLTIPEATVFLKYEIEVSSRVEGKIDTINVREGERVRKGQTLAKLDDRQAETLKLIAEMKSKELADIMIKGADVGSKAMGFIVEKDKQAGSSVSLQEREINIARWQKSQYDVMQAQQEKLIAAQEFIKARRDLEYHTIVSDIDGEVERITKKIGENVKPGEVVFRLVNQDRLFVEGAIEAQQAVRVQPGIRAIVEPQIPSQVHRELRYHVSPVTALAVTPDGHFLASASLDGTVVLWDWRTGQPAVLRCESEVHSVACGPVSVDQATNERTFLVLAGCADARARLWRVTTDAAAQLRGIKIDVKVLEEPRRAHREGTVLRAVAVSPDGKYCVTGGGDRHICMWQADNAQLLYRVRELHDENDTAHRGAITSLSFTPDGLISAATDRTLKQWKIGEQAAELVGMQAGRTGDIPQLGVNATEDRTLALFEIGDELRILDVKGKDWNIVGSIRNKRQGQFGAMAVFSPSAKYVLTVGAGSRVQLWTAPASPDETNFFLKGYQRGFRRNSLYSLGALTAGLSPAPGGHLLIPAWSATSARQSVNLNRPNADPGGLTAIPELWPIHGFEIRSLATPDAAAVTCGAFAPDESVAFTAGTDRVIRVWRMPPPAERSEPLEATITFKSTTMETGTPLVRIRAELDNPADATRQLSRGVRVNMTLFPEAGVQPR